jgi:hypothetical protein
MIKMRPTVATFWQENATNSTLSLVRGVNLNKLKKD